MDVALHLLAFAIAVGVSVVTTPVGVSGAVFLLPVQVSILGVPSPAVTPTNLLYNVVATPGALMRYRRQRTTSDRLVPLLLVGTLPGVVVGAWLRVEHLAGGDVFRVLLAALLLPLGTWLLVSRPREPRQPWRRRPPPAAVVTVCLAVGVVGGILGIGGGAVLAPMMAGYGLRMARVAPAALTVTLATSVVGVLTFAALDLAGRAAAAPEWSLGAALGLGGLVGGVLGARWQHHVPERLLRFGLGLVALVLGLGYVLTSR